MDARSRNMTADEVEKLSKAGADLVQKGMLRQALESFESAYEYSKKLHDKTERACAFNVGAIHVALGDPRKGLEFLEKATPPESTREGTSNGDLYFNFGLAYESLQKFDATIRYYEMASREYSHEENREMEADVFVKLGHTYKMLEKHKQAGQSYGSAARAYGLVGDNKAYKIKQISAKCEQANQLYQEQRIVESHQLAKECLESLDSSKQLDNTGGIESPAIIYNDLGLIFTQCQQYKEAGDCFEQGLLITRGRDGDKRQEAVLLQNLGAIYNFLGDYMRSMSIHEEAAAKYAALRNRSCQGQCFSNLAFAYSQLGDYESAGESFMHALQAAKDSGDKHCQWQALEGLGAVAFNLRRIDKAVKYYKEALKVLGNEEGNEAQDRIVGKLAHALEFQIKVQSNPNATFNWGTQSVGAVQTMTPSIQNYTITGVMNSASESQRRPGQEIDENKLNYGMRPGSKKFKTVPKGLSLSTSLPNGDVEESESESSESESETESESESSTESSSEAEEKKTKVDRERRVNQGSASYRKETTENRPSIQEAYEDALRSKEAEEKEDEDSESESEEETESDMTEEVTTTTESKSVSNIQQQTMTKPPVQVQDTAVTQETAKTPVKKRTSFMRPDSSHGKTSNLSNTRRHMAPLLVDDEEEEETGSDTDADLSAGSMPRPHRTHRRTRQPSTSQDSDDTVAGVDTPREMRQDSESRSLGQPPPPDPPHHMKRHAAGPPPPPVESPQNTMTGTYETPMFTSNADSEWSRKTLEEGDRTHYAQIDFDSTMGLNNSGKENKLEAPIPEEEDEKLYETINPRENVDSAGMSSQVQSDMSHLPRAEQERLMYEAHQRRLAENPENSAENPPQESQRSRACVIM